MSNKLTIEFCKKEALKRNYELLTKVYSNNLTHMLFIHKENNCNHKYLASWGNFSQGKGCPKCYGNIKPTIKFCKEHSIKRGYVLLSDEYVKGNNHLNVSL